MSIEQVVVTAAYSLPSQLFMFAIAVVMALTLPRPRAAGKQLVLAFFLGWIATLLLIPFISDSLADLQRHPKPLYVAQLALSFAVLAIVPKILSRKVPPAAP